MKKENLWKQILKKIWGGRAAFGLAVAVSVFLCALTVSEIFALKMEWDVPALAKITGGADSHLFAGYRNEEMALDDSTENVLLQDAEPEQEAEVSMEGTGNTEAQKPERQEGKTGQAADGRLEDQVTQGSPETEQGSGAFGTDEAETTEKGGAEEETETEEEDEFPYYIKVNRQQNCITIYTKDENGEYTVPYKAMICSTGLYNATPKGVFHLSTKYLWRELYGGVFGQYATRITGGILFHSVPYASKDKSTLYADKYNKLGQQASMGCVRLTVEDAKWISENCPSGTTVEVYDDEDPGPLGKPEAVKIDLDSPNRGWDPTDPDPDNPWHELSGEQ